MPTLDTAHLGDEHDPALRARLARALRTLFPHNPVPNLAVAGSQEIETWTAPDGPHTLTLVAETYLGLQATGTAPILAALQSLLPTPPTARLYLDGLRPRIAAPGPDGALHTLAYDWPSGHFLPTPGLLALLAGDADLTAIDAEAFHAHVDTLRAPPRS